MWEALGLATIVFCVAVAIGALKAAEIIWKRRNLPKLQAERQAYLERVRRPDWDFYERHLQRPAPEALKQCYADDPLITGGGYAFEIEPVQDVDPAVRSADGEVVELCDDGPHYVVEFLALDPKGLVESWQYWHRDILPFALGDGFAYFLWPGTEESNAVYSASEEVLDDGFRSRVADDVATFIDKLRASRKDP